MFPHWPLHWLVSAWNTLPQMVDSVSSFWSYSNSTFSVKPAMMVLFKIASSPFHPCTSLIALTQLRIFSPWYLSCSNMNVPIIVWFLPKMPEIFICFIYCISQASRRMLGYMRYSINKCLNGWMDEFPYIAWGYWTSLGWGWQISESDGGVDRWYRVMMETSF